jgi:CheY-like chemotaxis protein
VQSVLIIEDSHVLRRLLEVSLSPLGLDVHTATTITEGKRSVMGLKPDVVILDIGLPDGNGTELLTWIRQDNNLAKVKVVMASGLANNSDIEWALNAGASGFVTKPYTPDDIRHAVLELLAGADTLTASAVYH